MLDTNDFVGWIDSSHRLFEIFEGRYDAYPLSKDWVNEWFFRGEFTVKPSDEQRLANLINNIDFKVFGINNPKMQEKIKTQMKELLKKLTENRKNIGFVVSFYLLTWNMQRFKVYFIKKQSFSLVNYFEQIGKGLKELKESIQYFRDRNLLSNEIYEEEVKDH